MVYFFNTRNFMKNRIVNRFLFSPTTCTYLAADGTWVENCQQAAQFEHIAHALMRGLDFQQPTQVVICTGSSENAIYLPCRVGQKETSTCTPCPTSRAAEALADVRRGIAYQW